MKWRKFVTALVLGVLTLSVVGCNTTPAQKSLGLQKLESIASSKGFTNAMLLSVVKTPQNH
jgi:hypothetical protein